MKTIKIRSRGVGAGAARSGLRESSDGVAINLTRFHFLTRQGIPVSHNGVVTPNHPDMVWLLRPASGSPSYSEPVANPV